jgi:hypothetical protein
MKLEKKCQYDLDPDLDPRNKIKITLFVRVAVSQFRFYLVFS